MSVLRWRNALGLVLAGLALGSGVLVPAQPALAAELSAAGDAAFSRIASCAAGSDNVLASIVVDSSGSLAETDPSDERVEAVKVALGALQQIRATSGKNVEVRLSHFSNSLSHLTAWGPAEGEHAAQIADVADTLPRLPIGSTDYVDALNGSKSSLDDEAGLVAGTSCKIMLWFTDGGLDLGEGVQANAAAYDDLCRAQGIVDGLRADEIAIVALALLGEGSDDQVSPQDREKLRAIAEGSGDGVDQCGTAPIPPTSMPGAYLAAADSGAIARLFAQAGALIDGAAKGESYTCPDVEQCPDGVLRIPFDSGVERFRVVLQRETAVAPILFAPTGESLQLGAGENLAFGGAAVNVQEVGGLMTVDVTAVGPASAGMWNLSSDPSTTTLIDRYYFWGVTLSVSAPDGLYVGEPSRLRVELTGPQGPVDPSSYGAVDVALQTSDGAIPLIAGNGGWEGTFTTSASGASPNITFDARASATSAPSGIPLGPVSASVGLQTELKPDYPTLSANSVVLPTLQGTDPSRGEVLFKGSSQGDAQVCLVTSEFRAPETAGTVSLVGNRDGECFVVPAGQTLPFEFDVQAASSADGRIDGELNFAIASATDGPDVPLTLPISGTIVRPVDTLRQVLLTALFIAIALAGIIGTALVTRHLAARFVLSTDTRSALVPVIATSTGVRRRDREAPLFDSANDFRGLGLARRGRFTRFETQGVEFGRKVPVWPFSAATGWASASGRVIVSSGGNVARADGTRAPVEFPGTLGFLFIADRGALLHDRPEVEGFVLLVIDARDGVASVLPQRQEQVNTASWTTIVATAREAARTVVAPNTTARGPGGNHDEQSSRVGLPTAPTAPPLHWDEVLGKEPQPTKPGESSDDQLRGQGSPKPPKSVNFWD